MDRELNEVLADVLGEAAVLRRNKGAFAIDRVETFVADVKQAASEYMTWVSEREAMIRSGHAEPWFRQRFAEWQRMGHARWNPVRPRERQYRLLIVPLDSADLDVVRSAARRAARAIADEGPVR